MIIVKNKPPPPIEIMTNALNGSKLHDLTKSCTKSGEHRQDLSKIFDFYCLLIQEGDQEY